MATGNDDGEIEELLDETLELKKSLRKSDSYSTLPPNTKKKSKPPVMQRNRLHRSTVRPFFCCGSELSLNSIADVKEASLSSALYQNDGDTEFTDSSFSDLTNNKDIFLSEKKGYGNQLVLFENNGTKLKTVKSRKKKEKVSGRKRFFQFSKNKYTPRSRYPSSPSLSDSSGSEVGCMCTAHHSKSDHSPIQTPVFMNRGQLKVKAPKTPAGTLRMLDRLASSSFDELVFVDDNGERGLPVNEALELADILFSHNRLLGATASPSSNNPASTLVTAVSESQDEDYDDQQASQPSGSRVYQQIPYPPAVHTQVDYVHCLVPDLTTITRCSYYWGVMDRYAAEKLLENKPEGTFLLRDSAQEEFLFSVSFRRYGRSLHARIEQWNHRFSFDIHDSGVFSSDSVCGLIEHYKDPTSCMFFEPMLTIPSNRSFPFSLKHLCRPVICNRVTYDAVNCLPLPKSLKDYLQYYHYKHMVRVRRFDGPEKKKSSSSCVSQKS